jgi:hypothetical protein
MNDVIHYDLCKKSYTKPLLFYSTISPLTYALTIRSDEELFFK